MDNTISGKKTELGKEHQSDEFQPGDLFAQQYTILSKGLKGGMGVVYKCRDEKLHIDCALKIIHPRLIESQEALGRFRQEVAISLRLTHKNIVRVYNLGEFEGIEFFTMEWVEGRTLRELLIERKEKGQPFSLEEAQIIISQLSDALQEAHKFTVHRDIKPENILIETGERNFGLTRVVIKLTDFGIAKMLTPSRFIFTSLQMGTPYYMAPEQKEDAAHVDKRADIYSVGVVLRELLTLENTIGLEMPSEINPNLPREIDNVIKKALATKPESRYADIVELDLAVSKVIEADLKRVEEEKREYRRIEEERKKLEEDCLKKENEQEKQEEERKQKEAEEAEIKRKEAERHRKIKEETFLNEASSGNQGGEELYEESLRIFYEGEAVVGRIVGIDKEFIMVDIGYKSEGRIPIHEFLTTSGEIAAQVGERVDVLIEGRDDGKGYIRLSKKLDKNKILLWDKIGRIYQEDDVIEGKIIRKVKGGLTVDIGIPAFLPGSQIDLQPVQDMDNLVGVQFPFKILRYNKGRNIVVLSRRVLLEGPEEVKKQNEKWKSGGKKQEEAARWQAEAKQKKQGDESRNLMDYETGMKFILIKGGTFEMGDTFGNGSGDEKPVHKVILGDYYIGKYPVTQGQWNAVMEDEWSYINKEKNRYPVEDVCWHDAHEFIKRLNQKTGQKYRLPTEAEWEYAARSGGEYERFAGTSDWDELGKYAWFLENSNDKTHPVGQKRPNRLGLYDMSGNIREWCQDWYRKYPSSSVTNPTGPSKGNTRVLRGGCYRDPSTTLRATCRYDDDPDYPFSNGFRLARSL